MDKWKEIKFEQIASVEKLVGEFYVMELKKTPYSRLRVKIVENQLGFFKGFTNVQIKDEAGYFFECVGFGNTVEDALYETIKYFIETLEEKEQWNEDDFDWIDSSDF